MQYLEQTHGHHHRKLQQTCIENKFTLGETQFNSIKHVGLDNRYNLVSLTATTQKCCEQYWTRLGGNTPQSSTYMATYHLSWKLSTLDEPDMRDIAGEVGTSS